MSERSERPYFSWYPDVGVSYWATEEEAAQHAASMLEAANNGDEWDDDADLIRYGRILGEVEQASVWQHTIACPAHDSGDDSHCVNRGGCVEAVDYALRPVPGGTLAELLMENTQLRAQVAALTRALEDAESSVADAEAGGRLAYEQVLESHEAAMHETKVREAEIQARAAAALAQVCDIQRILGVRS